MDQTEEIRRHISKVLAEGQSSQEIVISLVDVCAISLEQALTEVRGYYDNWQELLDGTKLEVQDHLNWHIYMRHKALQLALTGGQVGTALSILDSLAKIQKIVDVTDEREIPIKIVLRPKEETDESKQKEREVDTSDN